MDNVKELSFENALEKLEQIIKLLEKGDCEIEKAVEYYEKGTELKEFCMKTLNHAKEKIEIINKLSIQEYQDME